MDFIKESFNNTKSRLGAAFASKPASTIDKAEESIKNLAEKSKSSIENIGDSIKKKVDMSKTRVIPKSVSSAASSAASAVASSLPSNHNPTELERIETTATGFFSNNWMSITFWGGIIILILMLIFNATKYITDMMDFFKHISGSMMELGKTSDANGSDTDTGKSDKPDMTLLRDSLKPNNGNLEDDADDDADDADDDNDDDDDDDDDDNGNGKDGQEMPTRKPATVNDTKEYEPQPVETTENTSTKGTAGYCYVGSDNGIRACARVGKDNVCMSGEIFPTREVCMNPKLRA